MPRDIGLASPPFDRLRFDNTRYLYFFVVTRAMGDHDLPTGVFSKDHHQLHQEIMQKEEILRIRKYAHLFQHVAEDEDTSATPSERVELPARRFDLLAALRHGSPAEQLEGQEQKAHSLRDLLLGPRQLFPRTIRSQGRILCIYRQNGILA